MKISHSGLHGIDEEYVGRSSRSSSKSSSSTSSLRSPHHPPCYNPHHIPQGGRGISCKSVPRTIQQCQCAAKKKQMRYVCINIHTHPHILSPVCIYKHMCNFFSGCNEHDALGFIVVLHPIKAWREAWTNNYFVAFLLACAEKAFCIGVNGLFFHINLPTPALE